MFDSSSKFRLIACEILRDEFEYLLSKRDETPNLPQVEAEFLPKGLHDVSIQERKNALEKAVREADLSGKYDAILLGYGVCGRGIIGLSASRTPLVVPRVHDCISLLFGGLEAYENYFFAHPGTYFETIGWQRLGDDLTQFPPDSIQAQCGAGESLASFCEKYGPENGKYLWETLGDMTRNYTRLTFLKTVPKMEDECVKKARTKALKNEWSLDVLSGNLILLQNLLDGNWKKKFFLVLPPGKILSDSFQKDLISF